MEPVKTSSFQLPSSQIVPIVFVRLDDGSIVPRHPSEVIKRPAPAPAK
ncbi:MAG TPA: hypothetical protein VJN96_09090 [Vicinamibacterales bacterium]|nr:hypothetical protein [Vicinamibacterales bacterium]